VKGRLTLTKKGAWILEPEGGKPPLQVKAAEVTRSLFPLDPKKHNGLEVEFDLGKGQAVKIREAGESWQESVPRGRPYTSPRTEGGQAVPPNDFSRERRGETGRHREGAERSANLPRHFHNPYNFVPAPPRRLDHEELGDHLPAGHDCFLPDRWSGQIRVRMVAETPLLIPDASHASEDENGHKTFPIRSGIDGRPYVPPTSVKGMLRAAYEAVTNSRLAVFEKHEERLAYRMAARIGPVPARVEQKDGRLVLRVMKAGVVGYAAKLRRYSAEKNMPRDKGQRHAVPKYPSGQFPEHGDAVWVSLDRDGSVIDIKLRDGNEDGMRAGWACITGQNINRKRYERVFLEGRDDQFITLTVEHETLWGELIRNYQESHRRDLAARESVGQQPWEYLGGEPGKTGWSRHVYERGADELREGTLCYVEFNAPEDYTSGIRALLPVTISRRLYPVSPASLLDDSLKPAPGLENLSPADRVFGWVKRDGQGAYRGNLRVGQVTCESEGAVESFSEDGVPLAILGQPKPQQARFYVARTPQGQAQEDGAPREQAGFLPGKGLRGRKVYPHHTGLPINHWDDPLTDRTAENDAGHFQEFRRPQKPETGEEQRDDQNRSITGWVRPGTIFTFAVHVTNLSDVELGALLFLLELPPSHYHRFGGAKPLGFGSMALLIDWEITDLRRGEDWAAFYRSFEPGTITGDDLAKGCVAAYRKAVVDAYTGGADGFENVPFIGAFLQAARGFNDQKPTHYPRARQAGQPSPVPPHPEGKSFEWFVENERTGRQGGPKLALPDLTDEKGLPYLDIRQR
jgi:CRISPR-associated protein (TIGR03986 family)